MTVVDSKILIIVSFVAWDPLTASFGRDISLNKENNLNGNSNNQLPWEEEIVLYPQSFIREMETPLGILS